MPGALGSLGGRESFCRGPGLFLGLLGVQLDTSPKQPTETCPGFGCTRSCTRGMMNKASAFAAEAFAKLVNHLARDPGVHAMVRHPNVLTIGGAERW